MLGKDRGGWLGRLIRREEGEFVKRQNSLLVVLLVTAERERERESDEVQGRRKVEKNESLEKCRDSNFWTRLVIVVYFYWGRLKSPSISIKRSDN